MQNGGREDVVVEEVEFGGGEKKLLMDVQEAI